MHAVGLLPETRAMFCGEMWPCVVLADLNKALGNTMDAHEAAQMHQNFSQQLLQDHIAACSLPEHNLISVCKTDTSSSSSFSLFALTPRWIYMFSLCDCGVCAVCLLAVLLPLQCFSFFFPVDWRSSSCADPSPEWPNHQPRKPAMRHHLSGLTMMVTDTLSQVADWSRTACYQTAVAEIREDCLLFHNAPRLSSITFLIVAKQLLASCMCFMLSGGMDAYGT